MKYKITLNNKIYEVVVEDSKAILEDEYEAMSPKAASAVSAPAVEAATSSASAQTVATGAGEAINAPLPGTVIKVLGKSGDKVKKGQPVVVVEAMKMENDIMSPKDGVLTGVYVQKGQSVEKDAPLFSVK